jgi:uncharacterized protein YjbI with pentapeptide repeats
VFEQDIERILTGQRPTTTDTAIWNMYWERKGQPWRNQPEIDAERQQYLEKRRHRLFKENKPVVPLRDVQLSRADIEWLLATHEKGHGPLDWNDLEQRQRKGLHLWGADLREVDLSNLPLANVDLGGAHLEGATLYSAHLENANLVSAHLEHVNLSLAHLEDAMLIGAHLEGSGLVGSHLEGARLMRTHLEGADLNGCFLDAQTNLNSVTLFNQEKGAVSLVDVHWADVNLAVVDWSVLSKLGDERAALQQQDTDRTPDAQIFLVEFLKRATRAYRQLSVVLRNQGLNEDAARFAYRAQLMQRKVFWHTRKFGRYLFSLFLGLTTGYGYRVWRSFATYVFVILGFATIYFLLGLRVGLPISYGDAIVFSMTSFHGRGFSPGENIGLSNPLTVFAAIEAFVGLLIEVTFIATLTQRLFAK